MANFSYVHIPFCSKKCNYCGFTSFVNQSLIGDYINALIVQIKKEYKGNLLDTLYFGGGTPSLLSSGEVQRIIREFNLKQDAEISFEINPENADYDYLKSLYDIGINRLSIGIQAFDDEILKGIGRNHNSKEAIEAVHTARKAGFKNISIDLMYGLLNQEKEDFIKTIDTALSLDIEHISTYGLKIEENSIWGKRPPKNLPDEDMQADMYEILIDKLKNFYHYEISNFAKNKNFISRHNSSYWKVVPYYGFGCGAFGFLNSIRYKNSSNLKKYISNPILKEEEIKTTKKDLLEEKIFLGFRTIEGIDKEEINIEFEIDFDLKFKKITEKYLTEKCLVETEKGYKLTTKGILISNYILADFLC